MLSVIRSYTEKNRLTYCSQRLRRRECGADFIQHLIQAPQQL